MEYTRLTLETKSTPSKMGILEEKESIVLILYI